MSLNLFLRTLAVPIAYFGAGIAAVLIYEQVKPPHIDEIKINNNTKNNTEKNNSNNTNNNTSNNS